MATRKKSSKKPSKRSTKKSGPRSETIQLAKGLTRREAIERSRGRWKRDHRGFSYDPKTGKATAI